MTAVAAQKEDVPIWLEGLGTVAALQQVTVHAQVDGRLDKVRVHRGPARQEGRPARADRSAPVPGRSSHSAAGRARARQGAARDERSRTSRATRACSDQKLDRAAAGRAVRRRGRAVRGRDARSTRPQIEHGAAPPRLRAGQVAARRHHRRAPGRRRQHRARDRPQRARRDHRGRSGGGALHGARGQARGRARRRMQRGEVDGRGLRAATARTKLGEGKLAVLDNQINQTTATLRLKALVPNPKRLLWPNAFVKARMLRRDAQGRARGPGGRDPARAAGHVRVRRRGRRHGADDAGRRSALITGDAAIIDKGLAAGEQVVDRGPEPAAPRRRRVGREAGAAAAAAARAARDGAAAP